MTVTGSEYQITPGLFDRMRAEVTRQCEDPNVFWTDEFHNPDAIVGYMSIGRELIEQTGGALDVYCGAVGTARMLTGVSKALEAAGSLARPESRRGVRDL